VTRVLLVILATAADIFQPIVEPAPERAIERRVFGKAEPLGGLADTPANVGGIGQQRANRSIMWLRATIAQRPRRQRKRRPTQTDAVHF
jgi:hypothetical protein